MSTSVNVQPYNETFFEKQQDGSLSSARAVIPLVLSMFDVKSVVDLGCGIGTWLKAFEEQGVQDILGLDGDYIPRHLLRIPPHAFQACNLQDRVSVPRRYDLACSLEVAEHLPISCAERFVKDLISLSDLVLFSAAIPGQGGENHINEQWQSYWAKLFDENGYAAIDCIRPAIWTDEVVEAWYRQNIIMYYRRSVSRSSISPVEDLEYLDRVHPSFYQRKLRDIADWYEARIATDQLHGS